MRVSELRRGAAFREHEACLRVVSVVLLGVFGLSVAGCSWGFDPYDDETRGTIQGGTRRVAFGQRIGPDGDGCWPERGWFSKGKVYCDLVSIGGLHWDTGDVRVGESSDIFVGPGFMCLNDQGGRPWCWEWGAAVPPRAAEVPEGDLFASIKGPVYRWEPLDAPGFVCGQTTDLLRIICWTVGAGRPDYLQATHRFVVGGEEGSEWLLQNVSADPPLFWAANRGAFGDVSIHAFSGGQRLRQHGEPRVLMTERLRR